MPAVAGYGRTMAGEQAATPPADGLDEWVPGRESRMVTGGGVTLVGAMVVVLIILSRRGT